MRTVERAFETDRGEVFECRQGCLSGFDSQPVMEQVPEWLLDASLDVRRPSDELVLSEVVQDHQRSELLKPFMGLSSCGVHQGHDGAYRDHQVLMLWPWRAPGRTCRAGGGSTKASLPLDELQHGATPGAPMPPAPSQKTV
jgi:hypothetical protein